MPLIGYARVSTEDQTPLPQSEALQSAGCAEIFEEHASGGNRARPVFARVLERIGKGGVTHPIIKAHLRSTPLLSGAGLRGSSQPRRRYGIERRNRCRQSR